MYDLNIKKILSIPHRGTLREHKSFLKVKLASRNRNWVPSQCNQVRRCSVVCIRTYVWLFLSFHSCFGFGLVFFLPECVNQEHEYSAVYEQKRDCMPHKYHSVQNPAKSTDWAFLLSYTYVIGKTFSIKVKQL